MSDQVVRELLSTPQGRRLLSKNSAAFFNSYYLGYQYAKHQENWLEQIEEIYKKARRNNTKEKLLLLAPRDHAKSWTMIAFIIRQLCLNRDLKILLISATANQAEKRVRMIKSFLSEKKIIEDWASGDMPPFKTSEDKWMATQVYLNRPTPSVDPTLEAIGVGGAITGAHVDFIILDDIEDDNSVRSASQRAKTLEWLRGTIQPVLSRKGMMLTIGTRKSSVDIYHHMIQDPTFHIINDPAIRKWPDSHHFETQVDDSGREILTGVKVFGDYEVLWPEQRPIEYLLKELRAVGESLFFREFQNQPISSSDQVFKSEWIDAAQYKGKDYSFKNPPNLNDLVIVQGYDLSLVHDANKAQKNDGDYTVGITYAKHLKTGDRWILDMWRTRGLTPQQLKDGIIRNYNKFNGRVKLIYIERNAFGALHLLDLQSTTDLPIKGHLTTAKNSMKANISMLALLFENGKIGIPSATVADDDLINPLVAELVSFGQSKHDDCVSSLFISEYALRDPSINFQHNFSFEDKDVTVGSVAPLSSYEEYASEAEAKHNEELWDDLSNHFGLDIK